MISLSTCVKGQKLRLRDGSIATYGQTPPNGYYSHKVIFLNHGENAFYTYTENGSYHADHVTHRFDVVEILPLETIEPTKPNKHPSVAWWESCPWIIDRKPTVEDGDILGHVYVMNNNYKRIMTIGWSSVQETMPWLHTCVWQPPTLTDKEKALELLNSHEAGWNPTPSAPLWWTLACAGL